MLLRINPTAGIFSASPKSYPQMQKKKLNQFCSQSINIYYYNFTTKITLKYLVEEETITDLNYLNMQVKTTNNGTREGLGLGRWKAF